MRGFVSFLGNHFLQLVAIVFVIIGALWIVLKVLEKQQEAENKRQPVKEEVAKIVDVQRIDAGGIVIGEMWVLFELTGGERVRLYISPQNSLVVGDLGILTWQGKKMLKFQRKRKT